MEATEKDESASSGDRVWTLDELRRSANHWSLASDMGMLQQLQELSQKMMRHTHDLQDKMTKLVQEAKLTNVRVNNAFNAFTMLANTQFVENRVYEDDISNTNSSSETKQAKKERTKEEREAELLPKITMAMTLGLDVIDDAYVQLDMNGTVSDSDDDDGGTTYRTDPILEAKDPYAGRLLPCMIGSTAFMNDDQVGLVDDSSEEGDVSDQGSISESEEEQEESSHELKRDSHRYEQDRKSDSESSSQEGSDMFEEARTSDNDDADQSFDKPRIEDSNNKKASQRNDFAADLAAKIGVPPPSGEKTAVVKKNAKTEDEDLFPTSSSSSTRDRHHHEDDEDSMFGSGGLFSSGGGLFDAPTKGGLFDDLPDEVPSQNPTVHKPAPKSAGLFDDDSEDLFGAPPAVKKTEPVPPKTIKQEVTAPKKVAAAPANQAQLSKQPPKVTGVSKGLFDDDGDVEDDGDLFAPVANRKTAAAAKTPKQNDLFADNQDDDDGNLFGESSKVISDTSTLTPLPEVETKPKKKLPAGARPMFGSAAVNPLVAAIRNRKNDSEDETASEEDSRSNQSSVSTHSTNHSLRHNDHSGSASSSSLFAEEPTVVPPVAAMGTSSKTKDTSEVPPMFTSVVSQKPAMPTKTQKHDLFDDNPNDDDGDLFGESSKVVSDASKSIPPPDVETKPKKKLPAGARPMFGSAAVNPLVAAIRNRKNDSEEETASEEETRSNQSSVSKHSANRSLRQNDHSGSASSSSLFAEEPMVVPPVAARGTTTEKKETSKLTSSDLKSRPPPSLFDDEDDNDDGDEDLFGIAISKPTPDVRPHSHQNKSLFGNEGSEAATSRGLFEPANTSSVKKKSALDDHTSNTRPAAQARSTEDDTMPSISNKSTVDDENHPVTSNAMKTPVVAPKPRPPIGPKPVMTKQIAPSTVEISGATLDSSNTDVVPKVPSALSPRKLAGAVSMFGGLDPVSIIRKVKPSQSEVLPPTVDLSTPRDDESPVRSPTSRIGDHQANLAINPLALLPGATAPRRQQQLAEPVYEASQPVYEPVDRVYEPSQPVGFDEAAVRGNNLQNIAKDRVRIQTKRRPPSRKSRQKAVIATATTTDQSDRSATTTDQSDRSVSPSDVIVHPVTSHRPGTRLSDVFGDVFVSTDVPTIASSLEDDDDDGRGGLFADERVKMPADVRESSSVAIETTSRTTISTTHEMLDKGDSSSIDENGPPPMTDDWLDDNDDINIAAPDALTTDQNYNIPASVTSNGTEAKRDDGDDLFGDIFFKRNFAPKSSVMVKETLKVSYDDDDDLFSAVTSKSSMTTTKKKTVIEDDIFTSNSDPNDDDEMFASASLKPAQDDKIASSTTRKTDAMIATSMTKTEDIFAEDGNDGLFTAAVVPSGRNQKKRTPDEDIFADDTDIFAHLPSRKVREKTPTIVTAARKHAAKSKSLFSDDVDDIFAASTKPKKTITGGATSKPSARNKSKATTSIFEDDTPSIFDDPLNALGKS